MDNLNRLDCDTGRFLFVALLVEIDGLFGRFKASALSTYYSKQCNNPVDESHQHQDINKSLGMLRIKPGTAGCEAQRLPLCYAPPPKTTISLKCETING